MWNESKLSEVLYRIDALEIFYKKHKKKFHWIMTPSHDFSCKFCKDFQSSYNKEHRWESTFLREEILIFSTAMLLTLNQRTQEKAVLTDITSSSSLWNVFYKKVVLWSFVKFEKKHLWCSLPFNKVATTKLVTLLKRDFCRGVFL